MPDPGRQSSLVEWRSAPGSCTQLLVGRLGCGRRVVGTGPGANAEYGAFQKTWGQKAGSNPRQPLLPAKRAPTLNKIWVSIRYPWELVD